MLHKSLPPRMDVHCGPGVGAGVPPWRGPFVGIKTNVCHPLTWKLTSVVCTKVTRLNPLGSVSL